jgi:hypothetical protein
MAGDAGKGSPAERLSMARVLASETNGEQAREMLWALDFVQTQLAHYQRVVAEQEKVIAEQDANYELLVGSLDQLAEADRNGVANPKIAGAAVGPPAKPRYADVPTRAAVLRHRLVAGREALPHGV